MELLGIVIEFFREPAVEVIRLAIYEPDPGSGAIPPAQATRDGFERATASISHKSMMTADASCASAH
jgi:hypothetical protein